MSKRTSNERAKEILKDLNKHEVIMFENTNNEAESKYTNVELHQALDIAIDSLNIDWVDVRDRLPSEEDLVKAGQYGFYITVQCGKLKRVEEADYDLDTKEWNYNREFSGEEVIAWRHELRPYGREE